ncbi:MULTISPECIES: DUF305 domain-containing protein [Leptolyngbya]|uniref:DUF305 domain-containing protein n=1 Tax=Leptolyngbya TaxID=47251 RepID=UPI0016889D69|nr:DUF305 domain-containing protein [Leptolyngbya sp. FACHB-1624]MBD1854728.1 DUF305 domain-containing protein [Leptolyngbya sp. FACHB-1624]
MIHRQPILYSLAGLLAGGVITALILLTARPTAPSNSSNSDPVSNSTRNSANPASIPVRPRMMGQTDQHFIVMMIPHHEDAVAMADLASNRAQHPELKALARSIKTTQTREIQEMQTWYKQWYGATVPQWQPGMGIKSPSNQLARSAGSPGWGMGMMGHRGMMGMRTDLVALQNAKDFDRTFIEEMIPHHQMAVMMAQMVLTNSQHPEIQRLAESIVKTQTAEINQMQQWYQTWYPSQTQ